MPSSSGRYVVAPARAIWDDGAGLFQSTRPTRSGPMMPATTSSVGVWLPSGAAGFWATDSVWANDAGDRFTFTANLMPGTNYEVYEWHTDWPSRNNAAQHEIRTGATLLATVNVNQQVNGGQWNLLGTYTFSGPASVTVLARSGSSTNADAVKFVPVP